MSNDVATGQPEEPSLRDNLAAAVPEFAAAVERERRIEGFCQGIRAELKSRREMLGLSQADIATKLEVGQSAISKLENGSGDFGLKTLYRYADALGVEPFILYITSEERIAQQIHEQRVSADPDVTRAAAGVAQEARQNMLRGFSELLSEQVAKLAAA